METTPTPKVAEEVFLAFRDETGALEHIMESNGSNKFYRLKKLNREEVANLLQK